jgi:hypothetical protein
MKVKINRQRELNTYSEVWRVSYYTLEQAEKELEGSYFQIISSLIFTAFTLEAYLNHIGKKLFSCWDDLERLSPAGKLNLIVEKVQMKADYSKRPFQTIKELIDFRNEVAHGKSIILKSENTIFTRNLDFINKKDKPLESKWQKYCSLDNAKRARVDIENIIRKVHNASKIKERLFFAGLSSTLTTLSKE